MSLLTRRVARTIAITSLSAALIASLGPGSAAAGAGARVSTPATVAPSTVDSAVETNAAATPTAVFTIPVGFDVDNSVSHVAKLDSDLSFGHGSFDGKIIGSNGKVPFVGDLTLPPASSYFVTFRFLPVTGTVTLVPDGQATGTAQVLTDGGLHTIADLTIKEFVQLSNVKVDGVPLDVGPHCRSKSTSIVIHADLPLKKPGPPTPVTSEFTLPGFDGCGVTEDLDAVLTGMVSGPGNTLKSVLTLRCVGSKDCGVS